MTSRLFTFMAVLAFAAVPFAVSAAPSPPPALMQTVHGVLGAVNADDAAAVQSYFSPDAIVVDEFPPFVWRAPSAGAAWWQSIQRRARREHVASLRAQLLSVPEFRCDRECDDAFIELGMHIVVQANGKTTVGPGVWTLTLHRYGSTWKVTTATWATVV